MDSSTNPVILLKAASDAAWRVLVRRAGQVAFESENLSESQAEALAARLRSVPWTSIGRMG